MLVHVFSLPVRLGSLVYSWVITIWLPLLIFFQVGHYQVSNTQLSQGAPGKARLLFPRCQG